MKRFLTISFLCGALGFAAWTATHRTIALAAQGADAAVLQADTSLQLALKNKDAKAAGRAAGPAVHLDQRGRAN